MTKKPERRTKPQKPSRPEGIPFGAVPPKLPKPEKPRPADGKKKQQF